MPRGPHLTDLEKGKILAYHHACLLVSAISRELNRSRDVVHSFLKDPNAYGNQKRSGRPKKLTEAMKRRVLRNASTGNMSSSGIVKALQLNVKAQRVHQVLQQTNHLRYKRIQRTPAMKEHHMRQREQWALQKVTWANTKWSKIVWSDEKKFNLDGPDDLAYKWHDLRKEPQWFSKRHSGGESVMVWAAFAGDKTSNLVILEGKQDGWTYVKTLEDHLLPFTEDLLVILEGKQDGWTYVKTLEDHLLPFTEDLLLSWTFMQDGAPCHRSLVAKKWLFENGIALLDWPAYSPDLNPIENLWGILVREVYKNQRQFKDKDSLIECILEAWRNIEKTTLNGLVKSMQKRCVKVIRAKGRKIDY